MSIPYIPVRQTVVNGSGRPYGAATRTFYRAGTTTLATAYADNARTTPLVNPQVANSAGRFDAAYLDPTYNYRVVLKDAFGNTLADDDNVPSGDPRYPRTSSEIANGVTPTDYNYAPGDVRRYGAVGDGATDDTAALTSALASGEIVRLVGTLKTTSMIAVTVANLTVEGAPGARIVATFNDDTTSKAALRLTGTSTSKIVLKHFAVEHSGNKAETLYGIDVPTAVDTLYLEGVKVTGFPYYGVQALAAQQTHVNCSYSDNVHAGLFVGGGMILLDGVKADNNGNGTNNTTGYGVVVSGSSCVIKGGRFVDNDRYGIDGRRADNLVVDGAYVHNAGYIGIYAVNEDSEKDTNNIKIAHCTVDMNSRASSEHAIWVGAYASGSTKSVGEILIHGNTIKNSLSYGIQVGTGNGTYGPESITITDNFLSDCAGQYGILFTGAKAPRSVIVSRNEMRTAGEIVVNPTAAATNVIVTDNIITWSDTQSRAIYIRATNAVVRGNVWSGTLSSGTGFDYDATNLRFDGNQASTYRGSATYDPASLNDGAGVTTTVTVTGAELGDIASASFSLDLQGITLTAWVSAANTVSVRFQNESGGTLDLGSGTIRASVSKLR